MEESDFDALLVLIAPPRRGLVNVAAQRGSWERRLPKAGPWAPRLRLGLRVKINPSQRPLNFSRGECSLPGTGRASHPERLLLLGPTRFGFVLLSYVNYQKQVMLEGRQPDHVSCPASAPSRMDFMGF